MRNLTEIIQEMAKHSKDNPTHGHDCACKDQLVGEARRTLFGYSGDCDSEKQLLREQLALLNRYINR